MNQIKIVIEAIPPSANNYMGNSHNFNTYRNDKKAWEMLIYAAARDKIPPKPFDKSTVEVVFYFSDAKRRDVDNYIKFLLDGIVKAKIIKDDSFSKVDKLILSGSIDRVRPRTEIIVTEIIADLPIVERRKPKARFSNHKA